MRRIILDDLKINTRLVGLPCPGYSDTKSHIEYSEFLHIKSQGLVPYLNLW